MSLVINTNVGSMNAQRQLQKSSKGLGETFKRLASGMRVNSARDDAAGLTISTRMSAQIRGLNQSQRNANDGVSLMQVAEGALEETVSSLQRMRELAVQASNASYTSADRATMDKETTQLLAEVQRVAGQTQFNGMSLLNGSFDARTFQVGANSGQSVTISIKTASTAALGVDKIAVSTSDLANKAITAIDTALSSISDIRANLGAMQNRFESTVTNLANVVENTSSANSRIMDMDVAEETAKLTRNSILQQAGTAILAQANQQPQLALQLLGR